MTANVETPSGITVHLFGGPYVLSRRPTAPGS